MRCELRERGGRPRLRVRTPVERDYVTAELENTIVTSDDGGWFSWAWADRMRPVGDIAGAADVIIDTLTHRSANCAPEPPPVTGLARQAPPAGRLQRKAVRDGRA